MKPSRIAFSSLTHYWRSNLAVALGVAAATAVLTGALIVGDSMRTSLRELTLDRLGKIDEMIVSQGFFREQLAEETRQLPAFESDYRIAEPAILLPGGTVEFRSGDRAARAGQVNVLGVRDPFWQLNSTEISVPELSGDTVILNQALADDLGINQSDVDQGEAIVTIRIPKKNRLPSETALGRKTDLIDSLVDLTVIKIIPNAGLGRFSLFPSQAEPMNAFLPIELLQEKLGRSILKHKSDPAQANVLFLTGKDSVPSEQATKTLRRELRPTLEDYGLILKRVTQKFGEKENEQTIYDYWSLSSDRMILTDESARVIAQAFPDAKPVLTYLANDIRLDDQESGIPFSMATGIEFDQQFPLESIDGSEIAPLKEDEIVLNEWAANDLQAKIGSAVTVSYFLPEQTHGTQAEGTFKFKLAGIAKLTQPDRPFVVPSRGPIRLPEYNIPPTLANDFNLTPEVPGVTDAATIRNWDLPFATEDKLRMPKDEDYWVDYRTSPKAFVNLETARKLWGSRFGKITSFRLPVSVGDEDGITNKILDQIASDQAEMEMHVVAIKRRGLQASSGSTPFDVLFLALSMFVIGSAMILVSLLFRLGFQQRANEVGILKATGYDQKSVRNLFLIEMGIVCLLGATIGILLGVGYAWLMIKGLTTWWVGAISRPFLTMHISSISLTGGLLSGALICVFTIWWSLGRLKNQPVRSLLHGQIESADGHPSRVRRMSWIAYLLILLAIGLAILATALSGEAQAGSFMGAGFFVLAALLILVYQWLGSNTASPAEQLSLSRLSLMSAKRNPLRSTLTIGLVAVASFLIAAVSAFRLAPTTEGTAGFDWIGLSSQPVFENLQSPEGQAKALGQQLSEGTRLFAFRLKDGEDASCNNLYQSTQPRALGVPEAFVGSFNSLQKTGSAARFAWGAHTSGGDEVSDNPWNLLNNQPHAGTEEDPIPVIIDKNTANYSLKIYLPGTVREVVYDTGERFYFKAVGFLSNTILQGSLLMSETDFQAAFPNNGGYRYFLIDDPGTGANFTSIALLEDQLGDQGFDARSATKVLSNFMAVQNTYLSTFQMLGALGLLLGTFGLATVQIRSVLERTKELGLMRAVGFSKSKLSWMVLLENAWLLLLGLGVGLGAAACTTIPHGLVGAASVPWTTLGLMFASIVLVGLLAAWLASRNLNRIPLLESLRG